MGWCKREKKGRERMVAEMVGKDARKGGKQEGGRGRGKEKDVRMEGLKGRWEGRREGKPNNPGGIMEKLELKNVVTLYL